MPLIDLFDGNCVNLRADLARTAETFDRTIEIQMHALIPAVLLRMTDGNVRSFGHGAFRVAYISTEEPAAGPEHLLLFLADEPIGASCSA